MRKTRERCGGEGERRQEKGRRRRMSKESEGEKEGRGSIGKGGRGSLEKTDSSLGRSGSSASYHCELCRRMRERRGTAAASYEATWDATTLG